jgi:2-desacetyl-2-hydroxyethyl bacteriochlorophyllide A dehydrogenase
MQNAARAVWFTSPRSVEIRPIALPGLERGQVLVHTTHSGVSSGTELLAYRGELDPALPLDETIGALGGTFRYPFRYGYSAVGVVEESRASVPVGAKVFAFHPHQDRFTVPGSDVVSIEGLDPREATLLPLVETAFQVSLDAGLLPGQQAIVLGLGPVGALTALLLARSGVRVLGVDPLSWRRAAMAEYGHPGLSVVEPDSLLPSIEDSGGGVPVVIEASGNPDAVRRGLKVLSHEGMLLVASWFGNREVALPLGEEFHRRRLTITSSQVSTIPKRLSSTWDKRRRMQAVVDLLRELPLSALATHTFPFEDAPEAYAAVDRGREGLIHVALGYD